MKLDTPGVRRYWRLISLAIAAVSLVSCSPDLPDRVEFDGVAANLTRGAEHCAWDDTWMILIGPDDRVTGLNLISGDGAIEHVFVREPGAVPEYTFEMPRDLDRDRPQDAQLLGTSQDGFEIWYGSSDPHYLYVESTDLFESWVRATEWTYCS